MITNVDWIALITIIAIVWIQIPYHNGNKYRAIPMWLDYIGVTLGTLWCGGFNIYGEFLAWFQQGSTDPIELEKTKTPKKKIVAEAGWRAIGSLFFSIVWIVLFSLLTASGYLIYTQPSSVQNNALLQAFYGLFLVNVILTKLWPPIFFGEYRFFALQNWNSYIKFRADKERNVSLSIEKCNIPTAGRVAIAGFVAFLIFATSASLLGISAAMVADNVITDNATKWVVLVTYVIYTLWTLLAVIMNTFVNCHVCAKDEELRVLEEKKVNI